MSDRVRYARADAPLSTPLPRVPSVAVPDREGETPSLQVRWRNLTATVRRNEGHPEGYLWIFVEEKRYFLGVLTPGMTRGDVRAMASDWLQERHGVSSRQNDKTGPPIRLR